MKLLAIPAAIILLLTSCQTPTPKESMEALYLFEDAEMALEAKEVQ